MNENLFDRLFRDSTGEIVIAQAPNLPILIWLGATLLKLVVKTGQVKVALDVIAFSSLSYWSFLEISQGDSYFRRDLGVIVAIALITSLIQRFGTIPDVSASSNHITS
jgi:hypothetical protein